MARNFGLDILIRVLDRATAPVRAITRGFQAMRQATEKAKLPSWMSMDRDAKGRWQSTLGSELKQRSQAIREIGDKARSVVQGPIDKAIEFQHAMNVLASTLHVPREAVADLTAQALKLGQTTQYSALDAAKAMYALANAGLDTKQIYSALPHVLDLAATNEMDVSQAATSAARMMQGLHLEANEMQRVVDAVAKAGVESTTSVSAIAESMEYASGVARQYNVSLETTAALIEGMSAVATGSAAGTDIADILTRLAAPHAQGIKAMRRMHLKVTDDAGNLKPIVQILELIDKKTAGMGNAQRGKLLERIFGQVPQRGIQELLSQVHTGNLQKMEKSLHEVGYAARMSAQMMDDTAGAQKRLEGAYGTLQIKLGTALLPAMTRAADGMLPLINRLTEWTSKHPALTTAILKTVGVTAVLAGVLASTLGVLGMAADGAMALAQAMIWLVPKVWTAVVAVWRFGVTIITETIPAILRFAWVVLTEAWTALVRFAATVWTSAIPSLVAFAGQAISMAGTMLSELVPAIVSATAAAFGFDVALDANPIGLVALAIGVMIANLILLAIYWRKVTAFLQNSPLTHIFLQMLGPMGQFVDALLWALKLIDKIRGKTADAQKGGVSYYKKNPYKIEGPDGDAPQASTELTAQEKAWWDAEAKSDDDVVAQDANPYATPAMRIVERTQALSPTSPQGPTPGLSALLERMAKAVAGGTSPTPDDLSAFYAASEQLSKPGAVDAQSAVPVIPPQLLRPVVPSQAQQHTFQGKLDIEVDDKRVRVRRVQKRGPIDLSVDTGYAMGTP